MERRRRYAYWSMLAPAILLHACLFVLPLGGMVGRSFIADGPSFANYIEILQNDVYLIVFALTFQLAAAVTLICLILGYPVAYLLSQARPLTLRFLMILIILPYFTSVIVRTFAWMILLGREGIINQHLAEHGLRLPFDMLYNQTGVLIGMSYILLPFMILTLYASMRGIDPVLIRAAYGLGASQYSAFLRVFLPLSLPGVVAGSLLVFILAIGFFITPALMGGPSDITLAMLIQREVEITINWSFASALATTLLAVTLVAFAVYGRLVRLERLIEPLT
jgi:ABC-type spermidine/putrescine transport system permease subunit I